MTRIFISHSHLDEAIAFKLFDFLICVFPELRDEDILCTSDPNSGLSFNSNTISDQLKKNLKGAEALVALITTDSLRSFWIPFEIGSFWPTEKPIVLILGSGLTPSKLPGPLKGWLSIRIEDEQAFEQIDAVTNQLGKKLDIRQNNNRFRRNRLLKEFITQFKAWKSKFPEPDVSQQEKIKELTQKLEDQARSHNKQLQQMKTTSQQEKSELEQRIQLYQSQIRELEQQLEQMRSLSSKQKVDLQSQQKEIRSNESIIAQLKEQIEQLKSDQKTTVTIEVELKSEKGINYTKLRDLLAAGNWKEAERETATVMLETAERESTEYLSEEDLENFPCTDLHTINQLWLHYSYGKFGFSVIVLIYLNALMEEEKIKNKSSRNRLFYSVYGIGKVDIHGIGRQIYNIPPAIIKTPERLSSLARRLGTCTKLSHGVIR